MVAAPPSESEPRIRCWRCREANPPAFFCPHCEAVQSLPSKSNYATLLGFGGRPAVQEGELQKRYYELSRRLHPDRFQTGTPEEQRASLQATALLNAAYSALKDVETRGRWWLEHTGESLSRDNSEVPPGLAAKVFEIQEKIADREHFSGAPREELDAALRREQAELKERQSKERNVVENLLQEWPHGTDTTLARAGLKQVLSRLSYLRTLARNVSSALED